MGGGRRGGAGKSFAEYVNVGKAVGAVISARLATLHELQTIYGTEDLYDMVEIVMVDSHNRSLITEK